MLRLGVMGCADIAVSRVIPGLNGSDSTDVCALASRDGKKALTWAKKLGIRHHFSSYDEMLENDGIDAVYIPLPNSLHSKWTLRALEKGKHVLCEKPLALSNGEVRRMIRVARERNLVLQEGFMYRFHPRNRAVLEMVRRGDIGELRSMESSFSYVLDGTESYLMNRELGGGALYDVGCYCVHVSRMVMGCEPVEVFGFSVLTKTNVDMSFTGVMRYPGNIVSCFHVSMDEEPRFTYRVVGRDGLIEVPWAFVSFGKETHVIVQKNEKQEKVSFEGVNEYNLQFEHFADCALRNAEPLFAIEDSLKNAYVLEALLKSADEGKPLRV